MRSHITSLSYPSTSQPTRWNNSIPSKVNINTWRAMNSRLPTRKNLDHRGMDLDSLRCPIFDQGMEVRCKIVVDIWKDVFKWWKFPNLQLNNLCDVIQLADQTLIASKFLDVVVQMTIWVLWKFRNDVTFSLKRPSKISFLATLNTCHSLRFLVDVRKQI